MQSPVPGLRAAAAQTQDAGLNWAEVKGAGVPAELVDSAPSGVALMKVASGWDISLWRRGFHPWPGNFRMPRTEEKLIQIHLDAPRRQEGPCWHQGSSSWQSSGEGEKSALGPLLSPKLSTEVKTQHESCEFVSLVGSLRTAAQETASRSPEDLLPHQHMCDSGEGVCATKPTSP